MVRLVTSTSFLCLRHFLPCIAWLSSEVGAVCVMTSDRSRPGTTVNFVNITSEGSVPPSTEAQSLKDFCYEVCACPDITCGRGCENSEIWGVDTKFVRLCRSQESTLWYMLARLR